MPGRFLLRPGRHRPGTPQRITVITPRCDPAGLRTTWTVRVRGHCGGCRFQSDIRGAVSDVGPDLPGPQRP